jgi:hypothetical protein
MKLEFVKDESGELWWCNMHGRRATHIVKKPGYSCDGNHHCDPKLGGITMWCDCVNLTGIATLEETHG